MSFACFEHIKINRSRLGEWFTRMERAEMRRATNFKVSSVTRNEIASLSFLKAEARRGKILWRNKLKSRENHVNGNSISFLRCCLLSFGRFPLSFSVVKATITKTFADLIFSWKSAQHKLSRLSSRENSLPSARQKIFFDILNLFSVQESSEFEAVKNLLSARVKISGVLLPPERWKFKFPRLVHSKELAREFCEIWSSAFAIRTRKKIEKKKHKKWNNLYSFGSPFALNPHCDWGLRNIFPSLSRKKRKMRRKKKDGDWSRFDKRFCATPTRLYKIKVFRVSLGDL